MADVPRRVWAQDVAVTVRVLRLRLAAHEAARGIDLSAREREVVAGIRQLLDDAEKATRAEYPKPRRWTNWWRGTLFEAAHQNLHAAEAEIIRLYDDADVDAEVPDAVARVEASLHRDDPRRRAARLLVEAPPGQHKREAVRKAVEVGEAAGDQQHARVRSFRNVLLVATVLLAVVVALAVMVAGSAPEYVPLCFRPLQTGEAVCPAGGDGPTSADAAVLALMGAIGGVLAAVVSIRTLRGTSTPYDVPVALSLLKVPAGALTALAAIIAIRGDFVPGLSDLDSQEQILAYGLVFGYAQQVLTRLVDAQAGTVLDSVVSKDSAVHRPEVGDWPARTADETAGGARLAPGGGSVPEQVTRERAGDAVRIEQTDDVLDLEDTPPVPLTEGALGDGYEALAQEHFGPDDPHDDSDQAQDVVVIRDDDDIPGAVKVSQA